MLTILLGIMLASCGSLNQQMDPTPTPFTNPLTTQHITTAAPIPITLENLASNPDFFVGATLQLEGEFQRLPILSCEGETYPSPATWGLVSEGFLANASGMEEQMRSLVDEGQVLVVEGQWLKHNGPVGCGAAAEDREIWYLSTDRILEPHPLIRLFATPPVGNIEVTTIAELPDLLPTEVTGTDAGTPASSGNDEFSYPADQFDLPLPPTASAPPTILPTVTNTLSATSTGVGVTDTPTVASPATPTLVSSPTATIVNTGSQTTASVTPKPTGRPTDSGIDDKGSLDTEDLTISMLASGTSDRWTMDLSGNETITITVAPAGMASIALSVIDSDGVKLVDNQNSSPIGEVETITNLSIPTPGIYNLLISSEQDGPINYALMLLDSEAYSFVFRGRLLDNAQKSDTLPADNDHFWFFVAQAGEEISFIVTPDSTSDPYIELYDPDGSMLLTIDDTSEGESERLESHTLTESGMYSIRVAEFDFRPMPYQISLSRS